MNVKTPAYFLLGLTAAIPVALVAALIHGSDYTPTSSAPAGQTFAVRTNSAGQVTPALMACEDQTLNVCRIINGSFEAEEIAASATDQAMGATGAVGDYLNHCIVTVVTSATGTFGIEDGTNTAFDNIAMTAANTPIGVYFVPIHMAATTAAGWEITTGAGATAACFGFFT